VLAVEVDVPAPDPDSVVTLGRADDTRKALCSLRLAKWVTTRVYDDAAARHLPSAFHDVVERHRRDEQRHLSWLNEAIAGSTWERETPARGTAA
jgi:hypothetical protein